MQRVPGAAQAGRDQAEDRSVSGWAITAILLIAMAGVSAGSCWRAWKQYQRDVAAIDARAAAHNARMDKELADRLAEVRGYRDRVRQELKRRNKR